MNSKPEISKSNIFLLFIDKYMPFNITPRKKYIKNRLFSRQSQIEIEIGERRLTGIAINATENEAKNSAHETLLNGSRGHHVTWHMQQTVHRPGQENHIWH